MTGITKKMIRSDLLKFLIFLIISAQPQNANKAGASESGRSPVLVTIIGLRDEEAAKSCIVALNRNRKRILAISEKGDGDYQIVIERRRPGFQVRVEKMGTTLKTVRALYDYEVCIAAAAISREVIADE